MLTTWAIILCNGGFAGIYAAPTPSNTSSADLFLTWQSQSNNRGTWDILVNCVFTMSLCIWTALHLNLPIRASYTEGKSRWTRLWYHSIFRQVRWVFLGLLAPELVVYVAYMQRRKVREMNALVKDARERFLNEYPSGEHQLPEWSMAHSWYLLMGGFHFETYGYDADTFISGNPELTITPNAISFMAATVPPLIPEISEKSILDCSKADKVTKLLALLQACYLIAQSIGRAVNGLPVSQLEINTVGHVLCALAIFFLWFGKPKDVHTRTPVRAAWTRPLCAYMWMCDRRSCSENAALPELTKLFPIMTEDYKRAFLRDFSSLKELSPSATDPGCWPECHKDLLPEKEAASALSSTQSDSPLVCQHGLPFQRPPFDHYDNRAESQWWSQWESMDPTTDQRPYIDLVLPILWKNYRPLNWQPRDPVTLLRLNLALQYFRFWAHRAFSHEASLAANQDRSTYGTRPTSYDNPPFNLSNGLFTEYAQDWPIYGRIAFHSSDDEILHAMLPAVIALLTACYGGLHTLAWSAHFPTTVEAYSWRVSAIIIACSGVMLSIERCHSLWSGKVHRTIKQRRYGDDYKAAIFNVDKRKPYDWMFELFKYKRMCVEDVVWNFTASRRLEPKRRTQLWARSSVYSLIATFSLARLYIVVEAFISLRSMPPAMYVTPDWTSWIPHI